MRDAVADVLQDIFLYAVIVPVMPYALTGRVGISQDSRKRHAVGKGVCKIQSLTTSQSSIGTLFSLPCMAPLLLPPRVSLFPSNPIQWVSSTDFGDVAVCGWLADYSSSRRLPLLLGLLALAGATVMINVGRTIGIFIAGRVLQGLSAAVVWVVGLALIVDTVGQTDAGQAMGYVSIAMSLGILIAPLLGGVVYNQAGYNAVFAMTYAIIGLDIVLRLVLVEKKVARRWESQSSGEIADLSVAEKGGYGATSAAAPIETTVEPEDDEKKDSVSFAGPSRPETSCPDAEKTVAGSSTRPQSATPDAHETNNGAGGAALTPQRTTAAASSLRATSTRIGRKLPPTITLLSSPRLVTALFAALTMSIIFGALDAVVPLYTRETFNFSSTGAGLIFLPIVVPSFLAPVFGYLADRTSPRYPATAGFIAAAPVMACMRYVDHDSLQQKVLLCALLALLGLALAALSPVVMAEISYVVDARERANPGVFGPKGAYAQAYGLFNVGWAGGALVGPIWAGDVKTDAGWGTVWWSLAVLSAFAAAPVAVWCGGTLGEERARKLEERRSREEAERLERQGQGGVGQG